MENNYKGIVKTTSDILSSFTAFKVVSIASVALCVCCCAFCVFWCVSSIDANNRHIYILDNGSSFSASAQDVSVAREDEVRDQLVRFHQLMFNLPPDLEMIKRTVDMAMNFSDESVYKYYMDMSEAGFYKKLVSADAYQQVEVENIEVDMSTYPYVARVTASQYITRRTAMSKRRLITMCRLQEVPRSANNTHGLMIKKFEVIDNTELETRNR